MNFRNQIERRSAQRFDLQLPVSLRVRNSQKETRGLTQDLSAAGALLATEAPLDEGASVELTLVMPSKITFDGDARVRCQGRVVRVNAPQAGRNYSSAIHFEHYEFLADGHLRVYSVAQDHAEQEELSSSSNVFHPRGLVSF